VRVDERKIFAPIKCQTPNTQEKGNNHKGETKAIGSSKERGFLEEKMIGAELTFVCSKEDRYFFLRSMKKKKNVSLVVLTCKLALAKAHSCVITSFCSTSASKSLSTTRSC